VPVTGFGDQVGSIGELLDAFGADVVDALFEPQSASSEVFQALVGDGDAMQWNFAKFLVNADGEVVKRYGSTFDLKTIEEDVKQEL